MRTWGELLDFNFLRPSAFERRHLETLPRSRPVSTVSLPASLPVSLPNRSASLTAPPQLSTARPQQHFATARTISPPILGRITSSRGTSRSPQQRHHRPGQQPRRQQLLHRQNASESSVALGSSPTAATAAPLHIASHAPVPATLAHASQRHSASCEVLSSSAAATPASLPGSSTSNASSGSTSSRGPGPASWAVSFFPTRLFSPLTTPDESMPTPTPVPVTAPAPANSLSTAPEPAGTTSSARLATREESREQQHQQGHRASFSVDRGYVSASPPTQAAISGARRFLRPFLLRGSSWNGRSQREDSLPNAWSESTLEGVQDSGVGSASSRSHFGSEEAPGNENDEYSAPRVFNLKPRPGANLDMTPRTDRQRRLPMDLDRDEDEPGRRSDVQGPHRHEQQHQQRLSLDHRGGNHINPEGEHNRETFRLEGGNSHAAPLAPTTMSTPMTSAAQGIETSNQIESLGEGDQSSVHHQQQQQQQQHQLRQETTLPTESVPAVSMPTEHRVSNSVEGGQGIGQHPLLFASPETIREVQKIQTLRRYLKKFMCVIATMPIIATLAIHNRIELVMWWVFVLPMVGIGIAIIWIKRLGYKLQQLEEENAQNRFIIPTHASETIARLRIAALNDIENQEPLPPPDYQSSIITPPAYIVQAPRKVPSYRSLENLFSFARNIAGRSGTSAPGVNGGAGQGSGRVVSDAENSEDRLASAPVSGRLEIPLSRRPGIPEIVLVVDESDSPAHAIVINIESGELTMEPSKSNATSSRTRTRVAVGEVAQNQDLHPEMTEIKSEFDPQRLQTILGSQCAESCSNQSNQTLVYPEDDDLQALSLSKKVAVSSASTGPRRAGSIDTAKGIADTTSDNLSLCSGTTGTEATMIEIQRRYGSLSPSSSISYAQTVTTTDRGTLSTTLNGDEEEEEDTGKGKVPSMLSVESDYYGTTHSHAESSRSARTSVSYDRTLPQDAASSAYTSHTTLLGQGGVVDIKGKAPCRD